ncbi:MAG: carboxymuconolactone decarboxylase family protein [Planctomycetes bacterium]|nr:carboxymuconolactone decarboxylase family protein [Planctomycetota bacterium]
MTTRARYFQLNQPAVDALAAVNPHLGSIDPKLRALVELRVSQINGCVYCVDLHSNQLRSHGETQQRIDCLAVWHESKFYTDAERTALDWAESLTHVSHTRAPDATYEALMPYYSEQQIVDLTLIISLMNAWNRIAVGHRQLPGKRG